MTDTFEGDVVIKDVGGHLKVWLVTINGATEPDRTIRPYVARTTIEALEAARRTAAKTEGRILWFDSDGTMSEIDVEPLRKFGT